VAAECGGEVTSTPLVAAAVDEPARQSSPVRRDTRKMAPSAETWAAAPRRLVGAQGSGLRIVAILQARSLSILKESFDGFAFSPTLRKLDQGPLRVLLGGLLGVNWPVDPVDSPCGPHNGDAMSQMASFV